MTIQQLGKIGPTAGMRRLVPIQPHLPAVFAVQILDRIVGTRLPIDGEDITIHMSDLDIGIYDADQNLVTDLNKADADDISFDIESQTCEIDGSIYHVILLLDVDEDTADNITHGQLRLYAPEDYTKAMETLVVPDGMYCPSIQL